MATKKRAGKVDSQKKPSERPKKKNPTPTKLETSGEKTVPEKQTTKSAKGSPSIPAQTQHAAESQRAHAPGKHPIPPDDETELPVIEEHVHEPPRSPTAIPADPKPVKTPTDSVSTESVIAPMYIVMVTPELAPVAKVGGLGDVVFGLSRALSKQNNTVEVILPKYDHMRYDQISDLHIDYHDLYVPWFDRDVHCSVWWGSVHGQACYFIEPHSDENFFNRGITYGHKDDIFRFAFFSRAAIEFMYKGGKHPEIIHCHDWQTGLVPVFLYEIYQRLGMSHSRVCYTIHNFRHQGDVGGILLHAAGLHPHEHYFRGDRMQDDRNPGIINLTKGGIVYANFVTTVSPRHAWEAKDGGQGFGLEPTLHAHHLKYGGVMNGIDSDYWNPETDPYIPCHYHENCIENKYENKAALRRRLLLDDNEKPIVAFIGRLDAQKGLDLVRHGIYTALRNRAQFVLLGASPDHDINASFWDLKHHLNDSADCHLEIAFDEHLAHLIYAGADMLIVPSRFEPCGLAQLIAMRYGTIPIVRSVGGLADSVVDKDYTDRPLNERNGYVFADDTTDGLDWAMNRAIACYYDYPEDFRNLILNAMKCDYSWTNPAKHYQNIYEYIREK